MNLSSTDTADQKHECPKCAAMTDAIEVYEFEGSKLVYLVCACGYKFPVPKAPVFVEAAPLPEFEETAEYVETAFAPIPGNFRDDRRSEYNAAKKAAPEIHCEGDGFGNLCPNLNCEDCYPNGCTHPRPDYEILKGTWAEFTCECGATWQRDALPEIRDAAAETTPY